MPWSSVICIIDIFIFITSVYRRYIYNLDRAMGVIEVSSSLDAVWTSTMPAVLYMY